MRRRSDVVRVVESSSIFTMRICYISLFPERIWPLGKAAKGLAFIFHQLHIRSHQPAPPSNIKKYTRKRTNNKRETKHDKQRHQWGLGIRVNQCWSAFLTLIQMQRLGLVSPMVSECYLCLFVCVCHWCSDSEQQNHI